MFCKNCGTEIKEGHSFCTNCGEKITFDIKKEVDKNTINEEKSENKLHIFCIKYKLIIIIVLLIIVIISFLFTFFNTKEKKILNNDDKTVLNTSLNNQIVEANNEDVELSKNLENEISSKRGIMTYNDIVKRIGEPNKIIQEVDGIGYSYEWIDKKGNSIKVLFDEYKTVVGAVFKEKEEIDNNANMNTFLEQIELIDPNKEYPVCYNEYGEYWILDSEGKKIYFNDVDSFKDAVKVCKERANNKLNQSENNTGYQINSSENNSQQTDVNINESDEVKNNTNEQEEMEVDISDISIVSYKKFEEVKNELERRGLKVNEIIEKRNVEFIYTVQEDTWEFEGYNFKYKKGETVNIIHNIVVPSEAKIRFKVNLSKIINDTNKTPLLTNDANAGHHSKVGVNVYFNNTLAFTYNYYNRDEDKAYEYILQPNQNVHVKISAPYYSNSDDLTDIQNQEFIISEYDIDTSNFKISNYELYDRVQWY